MTQPRTSGAVARLPRTAYIRLPTSLTSFPAATKTSSLQYGETRSGVFIVFAPAKFVSTSFDFECASPDLTQKVIHLRLAAFTIRGFLVPRFSIQTILTPLSDLR